MISQIYPLYGDLNKCKFYCHLDIFARENATFVHFVRSAYCKSKVAVKFAVRRSIWRSNNFARIMMSTVPTRKKKFPFSRSDTRILDHSQLFALMKQLSLFVTWVL